MLKFKKKYVKDETLKISWKRFWRTLRWIKYKFEIFNNVKIWIFLLNNYTFWNYLINEFVYVLGILFKKLIKKGLRSCLIERLE